MLDFYIKNFETKKLLLEFWDLEFWHMDKAQIMEDFLLMYSSKTKVTILLTSQFFKNLFKI